MLTKSSLDFNPNDPQVKKQRQKLFQEVFSVNQNDEQKDPAKSDQTEQQKIAEAQEKGHKEFLKEDAKEEEKATQQLEDLVGMADLILFQVDSANPLELFPS